MMVRLCVGGGHTQATSGGGTGGADLSLRSLDVRGNLKGEFKVSKSNAEGLVNGINNAFSQVAADQADKVRLCLQPVRERLLDLLLPPQNQGSRMPNQSTTAPRNATFRVSSPGFAIQGNCRRLGGSVICELTITNEDATQIIMLNGAKIYDKKSRMYRDSGLTIANSGTFHNPSARLIHGLSAPATFRFNNVPEEASEIYRLEFGIRPEHANQYIVVVDQVIPIT